MNEKLLDRESLKYLFENGSRPNASNFASLIDSTINKVDDGIARNLKDGLMLSPEGNETDRLISFYNQIHNEYPEWSIQLLADKNFGLAISESLGKEGDKTHLFLQKGGNVGIGTTEPRTDLEVGGILGAEGRIGTHKIGTVAADGKWQDVLTGLTGCNAFEIVAQVGKEKQGKYALMHAHALSTFGKSRSKISKSQAHYGWFWNKLKLRWVGSTFDYSLQIKTCSNYGDGELIKFHLTKLWDTTISDLFKTEE